MYNTNFKLLSISCISYTKVLIDQFHIVNLVKRAFNQTRISIMNSIKKKYEAIIPIRAYFFNTIIQFSFNKKKIIPYFLIIINNSNILLLN